VNSIIHQNTNKFVKVSSISLVEEMKKSYLDYAMSVIVSRALPDVRDGLKPVHRRILYAMNESGYNYNKAFKKSAKIVGDVMGKYHPHGDAAIYDSMVRMAQDFSMRLELIDGQGNFGSLDGDPPAAMRYTEARLAKISDKLITDIDKKTVVFQPNYDDSIFEPTVLPSQFPNLLVNGSSGIAVGMATNIAPHNLGEVIDATLHVIDHPECGIEDLSKFIFGPDFPTGGQIIGIKGIKEAFQTGRGGCIIRSKTSIEEFKKDREAIIVHEIPYQVNKSKLIEKIAETVKNNIIEGISDLRDESDRKGVRIVIELKKEASKNIILNQLYKHTLLQTSFNSNMLALNKGKPEQLNLKQIISSFVEFREEVVSKKTTFDLNKARKKAHILIGLVVANNNIDQIIELIKKSKDSKEAKEKLIEKNWKLTKTNVNFIKLVEDQISQVSNDSYIFSENQAKAILDLRLHKLTSLEREDIKKELESIILEIQGYLIILNSREKLLSVIKSELNEIKKEFSTPRRSEIIDKEIEQIDDINYIEKKDVIITISINGYIKRSLLENYRSQNRGGKGKAGMTTREEDFVKEIHLTDTHTKLLVFSSLGKVYALKSFDIPEASLKARGKPIINLLPFAPGERIATFLPLPNDEISWKSKFIVFATKSGFSKKNNLIDVALSGKRDLRNTGKRCIKLESNDSLVGVIIAHNSDDILLSSSEGKCLRTSVNNISLKKGLNTGANKTIVLDKNNLLVSITKLKHSPINMKMRDEYLKFASEDRKDKKQINENTDFLKLKENEEFVLFTTTRGFGKISSAYTYKINKNRVGKGTIGIKINPKKTGKVVGSFIVKENDNIILVSDKGQIIRVNINQIRIAGRTTQGVSIFKIPEGDKIVYVSRIGDLENK